MLEFTNDERFKNLKLGQGFVRINGIECATFDYLEQIADGKCLPLIKNMSEVKGSKITFIFLYGRRDEKLEVTNETYSTHLTNEEVANGIRFSKEREKMFKEDRKEHM